MVVREERKLRVTGKRKVLEGRGVVTGMGRCIHGGSLKA